MNETHYTIDGEGRDEVGRRYLKLSVEGWPEPIITAADTLVTDPSKLIASLTNAGVNLFSRESKNALLGELQSFSVSETSFRVVTKLGHSRKQFVLPAQILGTSKLPVATVLDNFDAAMTTKYRSRGTLEEWQRYIAEPSYGNSRLMFSISMALTGPILRFVKGPRTGGFQIAGPAEAGKSTAASVGGSVWGCHVGAERQERGFCETWHSTSGKIELTALAHNETALFLDETQRAGRTARQRAEVISDIAFSLAEGNERERLTNKNSARAWRLYYLGTSNLTFSELARAGGIEIDDAYLGRLFDIPCPSGQHGVYETLNGFRGGEELSDALKQRCRRHYGTIGPEFVRILLRHRDDDPTGFREVLSKYRKRYRQALKAAARTEGLRSLKRTASRFATVYAAGRLAIRYELLLWSKERLLAAILECQMAGLRLLAREPRNDEPSEETLRVKLISYLRDQRESFVDLANRRPRFGVDSFDDAPGYIGRDAEAGWFYLSDKKVKSILGAGVNAVGLKKRLLERGLMAKPKTGFVVQRRIFLGGKGSQPYAWVCAFSPSILSAG